MKRNELLMVATQIYAARIAAFEVNKSGYLDFGELAESTVEVARVLISEVDSAATPTKVTKNRTAKKSINRNP